MPKPEVPAEAEEAALAPLPDNRPKMFNTGLRSEDPQKAAILASALPDP
jgi:hypothetical protein